MRRTVPVNATSGIWCSFQLADVERITLTTFCDEPAVQAIVEVEEYVCAECSGTGFVNESVCRVCGGRIKLAQDKIVELIETRCEAHKEEQA